MANQLYGTLVLPSPKETFITLYELLNDEIIYGEIKLTIYRAFYGFFYP